MMSPMQILLALYLLSYNYASPMLYLAIVPKSIIPFTKKKTMPNNFMYLLVVYSACTLLGTLGFYFNSDSIIIARWPNTAIIKVNTQ